MYLEILRMVTDWLNDGTNGVVAQLATIPRDGPDPLPTVGTIAEETSNDQVAMDRLPSTPGIAVNVKQITGLDPNTAQGVRDGDAQLLIRYGVANPSAAGAKRDASYVLRAIVKSLRLFLDNGNHTRNSITYYSFTELHLAPVWQVVEEQTIAGAVAMTVRFRDLAT